MITVDKHEKGGIKNLVEEHCEEVDYWDDFGADYAVGGYLIERKRWQELAQRMLETDRHLYYQLDKTIAAAEALDLKPALLIEGNMGAALEHTQLSRDRLSTYLAGVTNLEVHQMLSTSRKSTAKILASLEDGEPPDVRRVRGTADNAADQPRFILEGIEGLGPSTAEDLLDHFGTVRAVVMADAGELKSVSGVGPATADKIIDAFTQDW